MTKWADYLISAVRFNSAGTHIDRVRTHTDNNYTVGLPVEMERTTVVNRLNGGTTFATIYKNNTGNWTLGAMVKIVRIDGVDYIKTYSDGTKKDNLDNLPTF